MDCGPTITMTAIPGAAPTATGGKIADGILIQPDIGTTKVEEHTKIF